jgi:hypothetical protein
MTMPYREALLLDLRDAMRKTMAATDPKPGAEKVLTLATMAATDPKPGPVERAEKLLTLAADESATDNERRNAAMAAAQTIHKNGLKIGSARSARHRGRVASMQHRRAPNSATSWSPRG